MKIVSGQEIIEHCNHYILETLEEEMRARATWLPFVSRREYLLLLSDYRAALKDFKMFAEQEKENYE